MKENNEMERSDLAIFSDLRVDSENGQKITASFELMFDVDQKFGTQTDDEYGTWIKMYATYNPFADTLSTECEIIYIDGSDYFDYEPTAAETQLLKDMITEKIKETYGQTPQEYLYNHCGNAPEIGEQA